MLGGEMQIYLDYSATTPPRSAVIAAMQQCLGSQWGNPSSIHQWGKRSALAIELARVQVGSLINAAPETITFTAGGTEADNLAIFGVAQGFKEPQHLIVSAVEHAAIEQSAAWLERQGWAVTRLAVDRVGRVDPEELKRALRSDTVLVSVIWGQSEIGTIQPIGELAAIARAAGVLFHTDAVQVAGRLPIDVAGLGVDLLSLSSHKIYGPQGAGALYVRPGLTLEPMLQGGGQEAGLRSGTQSVATIVGFGLAAELAEAELLAEQGRLLGLRDRLLANLDDSRLVLTGCSVDRLPHHLSFAVRDLAGGVVSGKTIVHQMNLAGVGISSGSACSSGTTQPSRVLGAMGFGALALGAIRLTIGRDTQIEDVDWVGVVLKQVLDRL
jgi:cysteine desulfurase